MIIIIIIFFLRNIVSTGQAYTTEYNYCHLTRFGSKVWHCANQKILRPIRKNHAAQVID